MAYIQISTTSSSNINLPSPGGFRVVKSQTYTTPSNNMVVRSPNSSSGLFPNYSGTALTVTWAAGPAGENFTAGDTIGVACNKSLIGAYLVLYTE
jgi:hypothetical protein